MDKRKPDEPDQAPPEEPSPRLEEPVRESVKGSTKRRRDLRVGQPPDPRRGHGF